MGALLNLADDHLEWHGSFEAYAGAKSEFVEHVIASAGGPARPPRG